MAHAHSNKGVDKLGGSEWVFLEGFRAYQRWVDDFKSPEKVRGLGDAYCYGIYRSTHRAAGDYLAELSGKYSTLKTVLIAASLAFMEEAAILDKAERLLWWNSPEGPDAGRNEQVVAALESALAFYQKGIASIEETLIRMG